MVKSMILIALAAVTFTATAQQPQALAPEVSILIDSALADLRMDQSDLWMPWDAVPDDAHRLDVVKDLFARPLQTFDVTASYAGAMRASSAAFFEKALTTLGLGKPRSFTYRSELNSSKLDQRLGLTIDAECGFVAASVLRKFLPALVIASDEIVNSRSALNANDRNIVLRQLDSLLLMSEEAQDLNLYQLKDSERRGLRIAKQYFAAAEHISIEPIYQHGLSLYNYVTELLPIDPTVRQLYRDSLKTIVLDTRFGRIAIGGPGDDVYQGDYFFIYDPGGNDRYLLDNSTKQDAYARTIRCIIDIEGDDVYLAGDYGLGCGVFGVGLLFDVAGNDHYLAGDFSLGCGAFGFGVVEDFAGHDAYSGAVFTQGAATFGIGALIDRTGNDTYRCQANGQAFGSTKGFGVIAEFNGNDSYITSSPFQDFLRYDAHFVAFTQGAALGYRPVASGGLGMIFEYGGNDIYTSDIFGQGVAYWYGIGSIYEAGGDDRYQAFQYAQGSGVHMAHGILYDSLGNDHYYSHGVSQGCGHDIAFGGLVDEDGDDEYVAESLSMGGANANGIAICIDRRGNDAYIGRLYNTFGFSDFRRDYGMIGIFADGGGRDLYGDTLRNGERSTKHTFGAFVDLEIAPPKVVDNSQPALTPPDELKDPLAGSLDSLFIQASAAPQKYQYNVKPARDSIIAMGARAIGFLGSKLGTESARERHAIRYLLPKLYASDTIATTRLLIDSLASSDENTVLMAAAVTGLAKAEGALPALGTLLSHNEWRIRSAAARNIGKVGKRDFADVLPSLLNDAHPHVRMRAAYALGLLWPDDIAAIIPLVMRQNAQIVRNGLLFGMRYTADTIPTRLMPLAIRSTKKRWLKNKIAKLFPKVAETEEASAMYKDFVYKQREDVRETIYRAINDSDSEFWKNVAAKNRKRESNSDLKNLIPSVSELRKAARR